MDETAAPRPQLNSRLLPFLVALLLTMQLIAPDRGWTILLAGLGGTWLLSYLWARSLARGLSLTREMRFGWAQVGDHLQERFTLLNRGPVPALWVEVIDHSTLPSYRANWVTAVGGNGSNRWYTKGVCIRRGLFSLGPTSLETADPFGLYTVRLHQPGWADLMVAPPVVPLPAVEVAPGGRAGQGRPRPHALERSVSVAGARDYHPGDSLRWIHWPTSARRDSLHVRLFDSTPAGDWWILVDANQGVQVGEGQNSTLEHGIILAASLADRGLRTGRAVGLITSGAELIWRAPQEGEAHRLEILRSLALLEPGERSLATVLGRLPSSLGRLVSMIIITPDVRADWVEALIPLVRRGVVPTLLLLDPGSFGAEAPNVGRLHSLLSRLGAAHATVTRDLLDRPEARPGRRGQWEWLSSATGRALPLRRPSDMSWRRLS